MAEKSDGRQSGEAGSYSPSEASSSMVSSTSRFIGGTPNAANTISNTTSGSNGEHTSPPSFRQAVCQLDCVVRQLYVREVSKDAAELIQASWRKELKNRIQQHEKNGVAGVIEEKQIQFQHL